MSKFTWDKDDIEIKPIKKKHSKKEVRQRLKVINRILEGLKRSKNAQDTHH